MKFDYFNLHPCAIYQVAYSNLASTHLYWQVEHHLGALNDSLKSIDGVGEVGK
jgi:hypothetical protein